MNFGAMARIAKIVAVVGFFLPWVLVSCSNQTLFSATGVDLAMGSVNIHNPMNGAVEHHNGHADVPILLAMMAIAIGLVGTFLLARRDAARLMLGTSLAALLLSFAGVQAAHDPQRLKSGLGEAGQSDGGLGDAALAMVKVENRFGYYLTLLGLTAAAGFSFAALYGVGTLRTRASELGGQAGRRLAIAAQAASPPADPDIAFWDGMADKNDRDLLHEYLLRFPAGRFGELARAKLDRQGSPTEAPLPETAPAASSSDCPLCQAPVEANARFCGECGAALAPARGD